MSSGTERLTAIQVKRAIRPGYYLDGKGLYLQVRVNPANAAVSKSWIFRYGRGGGDGKRSVERHMGLGSAYDVSLAQARELARQQRLILRDGGDPITQRDAQLALKRSQRSNDLAFDDCAEQYILAKEHEWKNLKSQAQWRGSLKEYATPHIGDMPVRLIDTAHVLKVLEPIWLKKMETASRVRGRIESVLDWAGTRGYREGTNPARWAGHLKMLLPATSKIKKVKHHESVPHREIGAFMARLRQAEGMGARALEFAILTAARSGEVRGALWSEIDLDNSIWVVPAERMKAGKEHRVPLSRPALALLRNLARVNDIEYVFPSARGGALSDMTLTAVMRRMDIKAVPHGFRSTFRVWVAEQTAYPHEVAEMALAHTIGDAVVAAYQRGDLFDKRRRMMQEWASYCGALGVAAKNVTTIRRAPAAR